VRSFTASASSTKLFLLNVTCLMLRGDIHVAHDDTKSALRSYNKALEEWIHKNPDAEEPPHVIESRIARLNLKK
jgi:hypothetical protein